MHERLCRIFFDLETEIAAAAKLKIAYIHIFNALRHYVFGKSIIYSHVISLISQQFKILLIYLDIFLNKLLRIQVLSG